MKKLSVLAAAVLLLACSKNIQTSEAVRSAVLEYLTARAAQTGLNMNSMEVQIAAVTFERDSARATVSVKPKNSDAGGMQLDYNLDRKGDKWVVRPGVSTHAMPIPEDTQQALPPGHPGVGTDPASGGALPPGHPSVDKK